MPAALRVMYGAPFVVLTKENPVAPTWLVRVAEVVLKPAGVVQEGLLGPSGVVQYRNFMEPTLPPPTFGNVKVNWCFTTPLGLEPPSLAPL
jgi:hypothetical protein